MFVLVSKENPKSDLDLGLRVCQYYHDEVDPNVCSQALHDASSFISYQEDPTIPLIPEVANSVQEVNLNDGDEVSPLPHESSTPSDDNLMMMYQMVKYVHERTFQSQP